MKMVDCEALKNKECASKKGTPQYGYCRGDVQKRCDTLNAPKPAPKPAPSPPKTSGCGAGRVWDGKQCRDPKPAPSNPAPNPVPNPAPNPAPSTPAQTPTASNGNSASGGSGGSDGTGSLSCTKSTNVLFCDHKFPSESIYKNVGKVASIYDCQDKCFLDTSCRGWHLRKSDGSCEFSNKSGKTDMKYTVGFSGGPRIDTRAGSAVSTSGTPPASTPAPAPAPAEEEEEEVIQDDPDFDLVAWIKKNQMIAGGIVLLCSMFIGFSSMMMLMVA